MWTNRTPRRGFLAGIGTLAVGLAGPDVALAQGQGVDAADKWVQGLKGKHRQIFDFNAHGDGIGLIHMHNYIETLKSAYGASPGDINVVGTNYGGTTPLAWNDTIWAKYKVGAALNLTDRADLTAFAGLYVLATATIGVVLMKESKRLGRRLFPAPRLLEKEKA